MFDWRYQLPKANQARNTEINLKQFSLGPSTDIQLVKSDKTVNVFTAQEDSTELYYCILRETLF